MGPMRIELASVVGMWVGCCVGALFHNSRGCRQPTAEWTPGPVQMCARAATQVRCASSGVDRVAVVAHLGVQVPVLLPFRVQSDP